MYCISYLYRFYRTDIQYDFASLWLTFPLRSQFGFSISTCSWKIRAPNCRSVGWMQNEWTMNEKWMKRTDQRPSKAAKDAIWLGARSGFSVEVWTMTPFMGRESQVSQQWDLVELWVWCKPEWCKLSALHINRRFGNHARNQPRENRNADEIAWTILFFNILTRTVTVFLWSPRSCQHAYMPSIPQQ